MNRPQGMQDHEFQAYIRAMMAAGINPEHTAQGGPRIVQIVGHADASAGTHNADGTFINEHGQPEAYTAALDISVRHDLSQAEIEKLLKCLWHERFAAWWRHTGSFATNVHVHAVYAGLPMKAMLRAQIHDFLAHRSGLVGHADDYFIVHNLSDVDEQRVRTLYLQHNS